MNEIVLICHSDYYLITLYIPVRGWLVDSWYTEYSWTRTYNAKRYSREDAPCDRSRSIVAHAGCDLREDWPSESRWISLRRRGVRLTGGSLLISFGTGTSTRFVTAGPSIHRSFASCLPRSLMRLMLLILCSTESDSSCLDLNLI